jgi:hypothetical protein
VYIDKKSANDNSTTLIESVEEEELRSEDYSYQEDSIYKDDDDEGQSTVSTITAVSVPATPTILSYTPSESVPSLPTLSGR